MTTRVTITNHGPDGVVVRRANRDVANLKPGQETGEHVYVGGDLTITEIKQETSNDAKA